MSPVRIDGIRVHESVTDERLLGAAEAAMTSLDNPGICIMCGVDAEGVEPDARKYRCESCGADCVYGVEELIIRIGG